MGLFMQPGTFGVGLIEHEGEVIGLSFGADATAEHEFGIRTILDAFRIDPKYEGIEGSRVRWWPKDELRWVDQDGEVFLIFGTDASLSVLASRTLAFPYDTSTKPWGEYDIACAWSRDCFGIRARGDLREIVRSFYEALMAKKAALVLSSQGLMSGFNLMLVDKFPDETNQEWIQQDRDKAKRMKAWKKSGVEKILTKAGKQWFSLGSRVIEGTDGVLRTWLNPSNQRKYRAGWYTFDELRQWAEDKGPVVAKEDG